MKLLTFPSYKVARFDTLNVRVSIGEFTVVDAAQETVPRHTAPVLAVAVVNTVDEVSSVSHICEKLEDEGVWFDWVGN